MPDAGDSSRAAAQAEPALDLDVAPGPSGRAAAVEQDEDMAYIMHKVRQAKRAARSELSVTRGEWSKHGYAQRPDLLATDGLVDEVPRIHASELTPQLFAERFERPRLPVVITGLTDDWPAASQWTLPQLLQRFPAHKFKVGSDDDGYAVRLRLAHYLAYLADPEHAPRDDSPLYIFDGTFADREGSRALAGDYAVPDLFREDLMQHAGERRRPPYRWVVWGPPRSGSGLHVDPLATSAWNALLVGHKRWALFPPGTPKELVLPKEPGLEREAASWFTRVWPRTQAPGWPTARPLTIIQRPGETVFVPGGWWHAVLNLDMTIAVTQNYVSSANFARAWRHTRSGRPKMSAKWLAELRRVRPDLAAVADEVDRLDPGKLSDASSSSSSSSSSSGGSSSSDSDASDAEGGTARKRRRRAEGAVAAAETAAAT